MREAQETFRRWDWAIKVRRILQSTEEKLNMDIRSALKVPIINSSSSRKDYPHFDESRQGDLT